MGGNTGPEGRRVYVDSAISAWDAVVIGGGLTGLRAALRLSRAGLAVAVISKVHPLRSHSVAAQGGMNAALGNVPGEDGTADSWENHAFDTVKGSDYLADQDAVALMCREAPATVVELEHMGTVWSRLPDGRIAQRPFGGAGFPRTCYAEDRTGHNVLHTLYQQVLGQGIPVFEEHFVTSLVTDAGRCTGCTALEIMTGAVRGFAARAVLLATGGFGRVFSRSTNALINTGDGMALALRAGAPLKDMEFVQFHPTSLHGTNILISEAARGEGGFLLNRHGERFMERYAPRALELAPRDVVARAIAEEIGRGNGFDGGYVHLDLRHLGPAIIGERLPGIRQIAMDFAGVDPVEQPIPVQPGQHYSMGGVDVDIAGRSGLPGVYAAGECACVSVHGANRLGGNSLLETVVFGSRAGKKAAQTAWVEKDGPKPALFQKHFMAFQSELEKIFNRKRSESYFQLRDEMKSLMTYQVGIFREEPQMKMAREKIIELKKRLLNVGVKQRDLAFNYEFIRYWELEGMLHLAEVIVEGALARKESRGSHFRMDYPHRDDRHWLRHTLAYKT